MTALFSGCGRSAGPLFISLSSARSGIAFQNTVRDTDSLNIFDYIYYYNGGGVAIGDFNNDGLADIYFVSNQGENKLYINEGNLHFKDITTSAHVQGSGNWKTGVTLVDINQDGLLDIYVSEVGGYLGFHGKNELFINHGNGQFTEEAKAYGLDVEGFNTQAVFFDYDHDGDLDMFLVNHAVHHVENFQDASIRKAHSAVSGDKLFRNDTNKKGGHFFTEVTQEAGIYNSPVGYGLNAAVGDLNNDGWPDIYVSNDFHENDYYYINNQHGGFVEMNSEAFGHESRFSMGSAIADMNNDGWLDIITLDMLPEDERILKMSTSDDRFDISNQKFAMGYHYQNSRNCLQLNTGKGYSFSEIGLYAGISATDWSWSPLAEDFDNDGIKDLFITNGIVRRLNDLDYLKFRSNAVNQAGNRTLDLKAIRSMPEGMAAPYAFQGTENLQFINQSVNWGFGLKNISTGAACADLDNDGDLDIVVNCINGPPLIYINQSDRLNQNHFLEFTLGGPPDNPSGIGCRVEVFQKKGRQLQEMESSKGFESSSLQYLHFGTGADRVVDQVKVTWPDGRIQRLFRVPCSRRMILSYKDAVPDTAGRETEPVDFFRDVTAQHDIPFKHAENGFNDFAIQPLIPRQLSAEGPKMAVADVNGDSLQDVFICGARYQPGKLFLQTRDGKFIESPQPAFVQDKDGEGVSAIFFDANNDGFPDLYVVTGGNEISYRDSSLLDRLYINDGKGHFSRSSGLPLFYGNKSVVVAGDFDHDGDQDLFVGGRVVADNYGAIPDSYLLINDGKGHFSVAPDALAPGLSKIGMVTDARWTDIDRDGWADLVIVGNWMPVTVFKNKRGHLENQTEEAGLKATNGLWNCLVVADLNNDGAEDLMVGNNGLNSKLKADPAYPLILYLADFNHNGHPQPLLALAKNGVYYPFLGKEELERQIPGIRKKYLEYASFAGQPVGKILSESGTVYSGLKAYSLASTVFINSGKGKFLASPMPSAAQMAPVFSILPGDFNHDAKMDFLLGGNLFGVAPFEGRYDALQIVFCQGDGHGKFSADLNYFRQPRLKGELRDIKNIRLAGNQNAILFARNNDSLVIWQPN